jgi:predicted metal-dependent hydrolase
MFTLTLGGIVVDVVQKDIKNVHLSVYPPAGNVRISAPRRMEKETIRVFAVSKLGWIKQQQKRLAAQQREPLREYIERESHYVWGRRYLLNIVERDAPPRVELRHNKMVFAMRPGTSAERRREILEEWYREQIRLAVPPLLAKWGRIMDVNVERVFVQRMKTKWGSCSRLSSSIRLNTELAKKPKECLEYIVVHEMTHLIERRHNDRFISMMDRQLPQWKPIRDALNAAPLAFESWGY